MITIIILLMSIPTIIGFFTLKSDAAKYHALAILDAFVFPLSILLILGCTFKSLILIVLMILSNVFISGILIDKITS